MVYCCGLVHMTVDFTYDATLYNLGRYGLGLYVNQMLTAAAEMVAFGVCVWIVPKLKRRISTATGLAICGFVMLAIMGMSTQEESSSSKYLELVIFVLMRFSLTATWGIYIVYVTELFPSEIATIALGYLGAIGAVAASASPYVRLANKAASVAIMATMSFVAAGHVLCLRETKGRPLRQRILEREAVVEEVSMVHHA